MKAVTVHEFGGAEVLHLEEVAKPVPAANEVLIEVHASSLNPIDTKSISKDSHYKSAIHFPITPGLDVAGVIEMVGADIKNLQVGDRVFGQASVLHDGSGAFAEYAVTPEDCIAQMPANISFTEAAALPLAACSAYQAIHHYMQLKTGQKIMIHGGSGGIGSIAIQLAKNEGAKVYATASGEGIGFVKSLGADHVIDYTRETFDKKVKDCDAVLDTIGGETYRRSFRVLKPGGIVVSMLSQPDEALMEQYGVRAVLEMTRIDRKTLSQIASLIEEGALQIHIARTYSLADTPRAYRAKEEEKILGKIAIEVRP
ncbi:NADP-dependent oxidoreductase [Ohtaekwangia sp.]|uniref:NADP-dependent oxidoreductase n=1 Tax=Ohtaekwangia sp. TaxID=2066019 RepID=UPI002F938B29